VASLTIVDTSVLIDVLRGHAAARDYLASVPHRLIASEVTRVELLRGIRSGERAAVESLCRALAWVGVDEAISRRAGQLGRDWRRSHAGISLADLVIAATALESGAGLATMNVRHFPMFPDLQAPYGASP
jgi:predicted nucleic acid-binding protein